MAPTNEKRDRENIVNETGDESEDSNIWASILNEVHSSSSTGLPSSKALLVLGDNESGKTSIMARLQGIEDPRRGYGLEYQYIDVKDEYRDDHTRLGVTVLDGDPHHTGLLKFALTKENFADTLVLLVVSMSQPWSILESLQKWTQILQDHINRLKIPPEEMYEYEQSLVRHFQEYTEPMEGSTTGATRRTHPNPLHPAASNTDDDKVLLPLGESTLSNNLGIPVIVVVAKSDAISTLEKEHEYREEHFDFIQQHIRKFCLNYGAGLFYTSVKENKNYDLLMKYIVHRIYGFPFMQQAYVVERDAVFVPTGWDNDKKISILYESMTSMKPEDPFEDVIVKPVIRKQIQRDAEIAAEDEQVFLMRQQTQLSKQPAPGTRPETASPMRPQGSIQKPGTSPRISGSSPTAAGMAGSPKKPLDPTKGGSTSEGVLANFFNSLLSKKPASPGAPGAPTPAGGTPPNAKPERTAAMSREAAAELHRMTREKKPVTQNSTNAAS